MALVARRSSVALMLALALLAMVAVQRSDAAVTRNVSIVDNSFTPPNMTVNLGDTVVWTNNGSNPHTTTGKSPLGLWHSGTLSSGQSFTRVFDVAGSYAYVCNFHSGFGMVGRVSVRMKTSATSGSVGTQFQLRHALNVAAAPFVYDVQMKAPGGAFKGFKSGTTQRSSVFNSTGKAAGTYEFRARIRNSSTGAISGWSPARQITVTNP